MQEKSQRKKETCSEKSLPEEGQALLQVQSGETGEIERPQKATEKKELVNKCLLS